MLRLRTLFWPMTRTVKLMNRVFYRWYGVNILVTLDMNKQEFYAQLNHYTSTQVVQSHRIQELLFLTSGAVRVL